MATPSGVGMTMAMPCDIRIAAEDAKLGFVFARLGILPGLGTTHLLPNLVGMARAQELVLTAGKILGSEAAEIGLVNKAVPADQVLAAARAMAEQMSEIDPLVLAYAKRALHFGAGHGMAESMKNEQEQSARLKAARDRARSEAQAEAAVRDDRRRDGDALPRTRRAGETRDLEAGYRLCSSQAMNGIGIPIASMK